MQDPRSHSTCTFWFPNQESFDSLFVCASSEHLSPVLSTSIDNSHQSPNSLEKSETRNGASPFHALPPRPDSVSANTEVLPDEQRQNTLQRQLIQPDPRKANDFSLASTATPATTKSPADIEEDYEPSIISDTLPGPVSDPSTETTSPAAQLQETYQLDTAEGIFSHVNDTPLQPMELDVVDQHLEDFGPHETGYGPDFSLPLADPNDSDDYEPPEPASTVEPSSLPSGIVIGEPEPRVSLPRSDCNPLNELMDVTPALPIDEERSVGTGGSPSEEQEEVSFFFAHPNFLTIKLGCHQVDKG
jgi:hypothetical protein